MTSRRTATLGTALALGLPIGFLLVSVVLVGLGSSVREAATWAGLAVAAHLAGTVLFARLNWAGWFPPRLARIACVLLFTLVPASVAGGIAHAVTGAWPLTAAAAGLVAAAVTPRNWRSVRTETDRQLRRPIDLPSFDAAAEMVESARRQLASGGMEPTQRAMAQRNLASALISASAGVDGAERLDEATTLLAELVQTQQLEPWVLAMAARELVLAMSVRAERHDIDSGYEQAVQLELDSAARLPDDANGRVARAAAQTDVGDLATYRMQDLDRSTPEFERQRQRALDAYGTAMRLAERSVHATAGYAFALSCGPDPAGRSAALELLRGLENRRLDHRERDQVDLTTAYLLLDGASDVEDVEEAARRARRVVRGRRESAGHAAQLRARAEAVLHAADLR